MLDGQPVEQLACHHCPEGPCSNFPIWDPPEMLNTHTACRLTDSAGIKQ